jgi:hypothetical protein
MRLLNLADGCLPLDYHGRVRGLLTCAPDPPPPPDYRGAAQEQGAANVEAARIQGRMNNPQVYSPYGSQLVTWDGDTPTLTQTFTPEQQAIFDQSNKTKLQLGLLGEQGANALQGIVGRELSLTGVPTAPGSAADTRAKVYDAQMARVNEDVDRQRDQAHSDLIAAGIRPGTKAYDDRIALLERTRTDAANQAWLASGQEAQRDFGMDAARRKDAIAELLTQRQTPLNEVTAILSGSQVQNPFAMPGYAQNAQVAPAPLFAATNAAADYNTDVYNAKAAQQGQLVQGLFGLGGAGLMGGGMAY